MKITDMILKRLAVAGLCLFALAACSKEQGSGYLPDDTVSPEISLDITRTAGAAEEVVYHAYMFRREAGAADPYTLWKSVTDIGQGSVVEIPVKEVMGHEFRFLFIAVPKAEAQLKVIKAASAGIPAGTLWDDVRIVKNTQELRMDNYYLVKDMTGQQILDAGIVQGTLKRIVGQMVFDIFRAYADASGIIELPLAAGDIKNEFKYTVVSVLDRVEDIFITYSNVTDTLKLGNAPDFEPVDVGYSTVDQIQQIEDIAMSDSLWVSIPQEDKCLVAMPVPTLGSVRIMGHYMLPSSKKMAVQIKMKYYDTTATCGDSQHNHQKECFEFVDDKMILDIPKSGDGIGMVRDHFMATRIGLKCDRVIDVNQKLGVEFELAWNWTPN